MNKETKRYTSGNKNEQISRLDEEQKSILRNNSRLKKEETKSSVLGTNNDYKGTTV
jgi:hypothetical protein